jgi:hypothetical protein
LESHGKEVGGREEEEVGGQKGTHHTEKEGGGSRVVARSELAAETS